MASAFPSQRLPADQPVPQAVINAFLCQQFLVAALFLNAGFAQHQNAVSVFDGGQAVGNRQRGATLGQLIQALPNQNLTLVVQRACGFVQQQDGRVLQKYPRNADALFLPAGKLDPAFAYIGIIPVFQRTGNTTISPTFIALNVAAQFSVTFTILLQFSEFNNVV